MSTKFDDSQKDSDTIAEHTEIDGHWERDSGDGDLADDDEEGDDDEDADAEAEEIARRLNDQLWADINKAQAEAAAASKATTEATPSSSMPSRKVHEALKTMRLILKDVANDSLARATLSATLVPGIDPLGTSVLDTFGNAVAANAIPKDVTRSFSHLLVSLASSDTLFAALHHSEWSSVQLELGKRQRDKQDHEHDNEARL